MTLAPHAMATAEMPCYVTPSHRGDLERFALLRHSLLRFSAAIPHYVLLDTEDLPLFRDHFGGEPDLHFIVSRDLLPAELERQRRINKTWPGELRKRIAWRIGLQAHPLNGWRLQQLLKIHFLRQCAHATAVFLDSDMVLCGRVSPEDYFSGDRLYLLETPATTLEDHAFDVCTHLMLRASLLQAQPLFNYIHQAPRFRRTTAQALVGLLNERNPQGWERRFIELAFPSEYCLLGYAARELEGYKGYERSAGSAQDWVYRLYQSDDASLEQLLSVCEAERGHRKFMLIQSNMQWPAQAYAGRVRQLIDTL